MKESNPPPAKNESLLLLAGDRAEAQEASEIIYGVLPESTITLAVNLDEYERLQKARDFDLVVIDYDMSVSKALELVSLLKFKDHEPAVLMIGQYADVHALMALQRAGCQRYLLKDAHWMSELAPAVRSLLRVRRLIEENRRLQAKLTEANMFLEAKNSRLDEFSATVAHDIRGPLGGICMKLEYLLERYDGQIEPRFGEIMKKALGSAQRLTDIVQAMYDFAKIGSCLRGMASVELGPLISEVTSDMAFDESQDIKINVGELPAVWGNADLLRRVFINLIGNAVKYSDKAQTEILIGFEGVQNRALGQFCDIYVQDNGAGIDPADLRDIFTMFRRGSTPSSARKEGMGVGLAVVQRIVELHFGKIEVASTLGEGTRFTLSLPAEKIDFIG